MNGSSSCRRFPVAAGADAAQTGGAFTIWNSTRPIGGGRGSARLNPRVAQRMEDENEGRGSGRGRSRITHRDTRPQSAIGNPRSNICQSRLHHSHLRLDGSAQGCGHRTSECGEFHLLGAAGIRARRLAGVLFSTSLCFDSPCSSCS